MEEAALLSLCKNLHRAIIHCWGFFIVFAWIKVLRDTRKFLLTKKDNMNTKM